MVKKKKKRKVKGMNDKGNREWRKVETMDVTLGRIKK